MIPILDLKAQYESISFLCSQRTLVRCFNGGRWTRVQREQVGSGSRWVAGAGG